MSTGKHLLVAVGAAVAAFGATACWDIQKAADTWCAQNADDPQRVVNAPCDGDEDCCDGRYACVSGACELASSSGVDGGDTDGGGGGDGGTDQDGGHDGGTQRTVSEEFCDELGDQFVQFVSTCGLLGTGHEQAVRDVLYAVTCREHVSAVADGRQSFDGIQADACLAELTTTPLRCDAPIPASCGRVFTGRSATGSACIVRSDCAGPNDECLGASCGSRTCVAPGRAVAAHCNPQYFPCAPELNLYCDADGYCQERLPRSSACSAQGPAEDPCEAGTYCDGTVCVDRRTETASCAEPWECLEGLTCSNNTCLQRTATGLACTRDDECLETDSCYENVCRAQGGSGAACEEKRDCQWELACDHVRRECLEVNRGVPENGPCTNDALVCADGLQCVGVDLAQGGPGVCVAPKLNSACEHPYQCPVGFTCQTGRCTPSQVGSPCTNPSNCQPEHYCGSSGGSLACQPRTSQGEACVVGNYQCAQGTHCYDLSGTGAGTCEEHRDFGQSCADAAERQCRYLGVLRGRFLSGARHGGHAVRPGLVLLRWRVLFRRHVHRAQGGRAAVQRVPSCGVRGDLHRRGLPDL